MEQHNSMEGYVFLPTTPRENSADLSKESVLWWLCESDEDQVRVVLKALLESRPTIMDDSQSVLSQSIRRSHKKTKKTASSMFESHDVQEHQIKHEEPPTGVMPVVQFSSALYYAEEEEEEVELEIIRIGRQKEKSVVAYRTVDGSAIAGESFVAASGILEFMPGETTKTLDMEILSNSNYNTNTEFKIVLSQETGCVLGHYLFQTRVKIIDNNTFPTDKFKDRDFSHHSKDISREQLLVEYCRMTWNLKGIRSATIKTVLADAFENVRYTMNLFLSVYLYDEILDRNRSESSLLFVHDRRESLIVVGAVFLLSLFLDHVVAMRKLDFGLNSRARAFLQNAILRKFFNVRKDVRDKVEAGELVMAIDRDAVNIVMSGYNGVLDLIREFGHVVCMLLFTISSPYVFDRQRSGATDLCFLAAVPFVLVVFLHARTNIVANHLEEEDEAETKMASFILNTYTNFKLLLDYSLRNVASDKFAHLIDVHRKARKVATNTLFINKYFARWITEIATAAYVVIAGLCVIRGDLSLGMFIVHLGVFKQVGAACEEIFAITSQMQAILPSVLATARFLNFPTELIPRKILKRSQRKRTKELREELIMSGCCSAAVDLLPIELNFEQYHFQEWGVNLYGDVKIRQGQLVALVGDTGSGKATLLRLMSGALLPATNMGDAVFVPAHLRAISVSELPLFFPGTLMENLAFGIAPTHSDAELDRIVGICRLLGIEERAVQYLRSSAEERWPEIFSHAQCKLLNIARALINNAELMCFHRPLVMLDQNQMPVVMNLLLKHVKEKGLLQNDDQRLRRSRTVVVSSQQLAVENAHEIIRVSRDKGLQKISKRQVAREDLM